MSKKTYLLFHTLLISILLTSCSEPTENKLIGIQDSYLKSRIEQANQKFRDEVYNLGAISKGLRLLEHTTSLLDRLEVIKRENSIQQLLGLIPDYLAFAGKPLDGVHKLIPPISDVVKELNETNIKQVKSLILIFTKDVIGNYHLQFLDIFMKFDVVSINVRDHTISSGEDYKAIISLNASVSALYPQIFVSNKKDGKFTQIRPEGPTSEGTFTISKLPPGEHSFFIRYVFFNGGIEKTIEKEHHFTVKR